LRDGSIVPLLLSTHQSEKQAERELDCLIINSCLRELQQEGVVYDAVRSAFPEGAPAYPGAGFSR
jgi:hypothetical protein